MGTLHIFKSETNLFSLSLLFSSYDTFNFINYYHELLEYLLECNSELRTKIFHFVFALLDKVWFHVSYTYFEPIPVMVLVQSWAFSFRNHINLKDFAGQIYQNTIEGFTVGSAINTLKILTPCHTLNFKSYLLLVVAKLLSPQRSGRPLLKFFVR